MNKNQTLIHQFYTGFQNLNPDQMISCYHENIEFSDPVFPDIRGADAGMMWAMLCARAKGFELGFKDIEADTHSGRAVWDARYLFSGTGRRVHNVIEARFEFLDGKIIRHHDQFNFWKWSRMALGPLGLFFGWSPFLKNKVRKQAADNLERFVKSKDSSLRSHAG